MIEEIQKYKLFNKLKSTYRFSSVENRKESSAEHSWGCLMLADFVLTKKDYGLNKLKVYELLMYHDVIEIEAGDTPLHPEMVQTGKQEKEKKAVEFLKKELPQVLISKFVNLFNEFEEQKTKEAKFAQAIDKLEAEIHEMDYKEDWKGWTPEFLIEKKSKYMEPFPELKELFYELIEYIKKEGYFQK